MNSTTSIKRWQSIRYINDDEAPLILTFNSIERDLDDGFPKSNSFMYNSQEDIYKLNSFNRSRFTERVNSNYLENINEENESYQLTKEEEKENYNNIFINLINFKRKKMYLAYIIMITYLIYCIIELIFGYLSHSLILMADAANYFSESSYFGIYIFTISITKNKSINNILSGFYMGENIALLARSTFILGFSFWLFYYIIIRFINKVFINSIIIIIIGIISVLFNIITDLILIFLSKDILFSEKDQIFKELSEEELNYIKLKKSFTKVILKALQNSLIIIEGIVIYFCPSIFVIDPSFSFLLTILLFFKAFKNIKWAIILLKKGFTFQIDIDELENDLLNIQGVISLNNLQLISLNNRNLALNCNMISSDPKNSLKLSRELIKNKYNINKITIEVELSKNKKEK